MKKMALIVLMAVCLTDACLSAPDAETKTDFDACVAACRPDDAMSVPKFSGDFCKTPDIHGFFDGPPVHSWQNLKHYQGYAGNGAIVGDSRRKVYRFRYYQLNANYSGSVDYQLLENAAILCPQTADFLYTAFTPLETGYVKGSRPTLETIVAELVEGHSSDQQRGLALMRFCRDLHKHNRHPDITRYVYGGTEEQLIAKGEILCETLARLMVALCEVAGMPGRVVLHHVGGHLAAEIYMDGKWGYLDPRMGMYFLDENGRIASVWDLIQNPSLIWSQSETVMSGVVSYTTWYWRAWKCTNNYFNPYEINTFANYSLADADRYDYHQTTYSEAVAAGLMDIAGVSVPLMSGILGLTADMTDMTWQRRRPTMLHTAVLDEIENYPLLSRDDAKTPERFWIVDTTVISKRGVVEQMLSAAGNSVVFVVNISGQDSNDKAMEDYHAIKRYFETFDKQRFRFGVIVRPGAEGMATLVKTIRPEIVVLECDSVDISSWMPSIWVSARNLTGFELYGYVKTDRSVPESLYADYLSGCAMTGLRGGLNGLVLNVTDLETLGADRIVRYADLLYRDKVYVFQNEGECFTVALADDRSDDAVHTDVCFAVRFADESLISQVQCIALNGRMIPFAMDADRLIVDGRHFSFGPNAIQFCFGDREVDRSRIKAFLHVRFAN